MLSHYVLVARWHLVVHSLRGSVLDFYPGSQQEWRVACVFCLSLALFFSFSFL